MRTKRNAENKSSSGKSPAIRRMTNACIRLTGQAGPIGPAVGLCYAVTFQSLIFQRNPRLLGMTPWNFLLMTIAFG